MSTGSSDAAREAARHADGRFGSQERSEAATYPLSDGSGGHVALPENTDVCAFCGVTFTDANRYGPCSVNGADGHCADFDEHACAIYCNGGCRSALSTPPVERSDP